MNKSWILPTLVLLIATSFESPAAFAQGSLGAGAARVDITPQSDPAVPPLKTEIR